MILRSLVCHRDVAQSITCLGTLGRTDSSALEMVFHEDGSLTPEDGEQLQAALPCRRIWWKREADARMAELLQDHPRCRRFRAENVFGLKLLDTLLLDGDDVCHYCDGDILFIRASRGLFEMPTAADAVFMMDAIEPVPWTFRELWQRRLKFVGRVNAGMYMIRRRVLDLDRLEWFLGFELAPHLRHVQEQMAWAWLASTFSAYHWDPDQVRVVSNQFPVTAELAAAHFIGMYRSQLANGLDLVAKSPLPRPMDIRFQRAGRFNWASKFGVAAGRVGRKLGLRPTRY